MATIPQPQREQLLAQVAEELHHAQLKHSRLNSVHEGYAVILEELDEFWDEVKVNPKKLDATEREVRVRRMRTELIQVAAMALRTIIEVVDRQ